MAGFSIIPQIGIDLNTPILGSNLALSGYVQNNTVIPPFRPGEQTIGSDGRLYVFAQISPGQNMLSANTTVSVTIATTGSGPTAITTATAGSTGGAYVAPTFSTPASLGTAGNAYPDFAWFGATGKLGA